MPFGGTGLDLEAETFGSTGNNDYFEKIQDQDIYFQEEKSITTLGIISLLLCLVGKIWNY